MKVGETGYISPVLTEFHDKIFICVNEIDTPNRPKLVKALSEKDRVWAKKLYDNTVNQTVFNGAIIDLTSNKIPHDLSALSLRRRCRLFNCTTVFPDNYSEETSESIRLFV
ncbi:hypothetical protein CDIK_3855 [Cucumispora dikerogammari]|nr:hypothetical protein CDIK_3855 [Cucumispora dikerogammari]